MEGYIVQITLSSIDISAVWLDKAIKKRLNDNL